MKKNQKPTSNPASGNFYKEFDSPAPSAPRREPSHGQVYYSQPPQGQPAQPAPSWNPYTQDPRMSSGGTPPPPKRKKRRGRKVLAVLLILFLLIGLGLFYIFGGLTISPINSDPKALGIDPAIAEKYKLSGVTNIALFGVDSRDFNSDSGRSDSVMILSIDRKNNQMKLTSVLRDSYVAIEGHGSEKIAHAYAYGGPELAIKTLNQNFQLDIKSYVTVNFSQLASVVDAVGGIDMEITEEERVQINALANSEGMSAPEIPAPGLVHLTGGQATAFARIRKIDSDNARADRQKKVIEGILGQVKKTPVWKYPELAKTVFPMTETSMNYWELGGLSPAVIFGDASLVQNTLPTPEDNPIGGEYNGAWVWRFDIPSATERLHRFIYG